jgi:hypothetical protein
MGGAGISVLWCVQSGHSFPHGVCRVGTALLWCVQCGHSFPVVCAEWAQLYCGVCSVGTALLWPFPLRQ